MSEPHIEYLPLASLVAWPRNPKHHATRTIVESIQRFGFVQPIIIDEKTRRLIAGHGRLEALAQIKADGRPVPARIAVNDNDWLVPVLRGINFRNEKEAEAYLVTDNQTTILGGWDEEELQALLNDHVGNLDGVGFTLAEIEALRMPLPGGVEQPHISNEVLHTNWIQPGSVEDWLQSIALGRTLNVCCGNSRVGDVRIDTDPNTNRTQAGDVFKMNYEPGSFDTVICDPPFSYYSPKYGQKWLLQLSHIAKKRLILSSGTIALNNLLPRFKANLYALSDTKNRYFLRLYWTFDRIV
jgi:hypothetical protein